MSLIAELHEKGTCYWGENVSVNSCKKFVRKRQFLNSRGKKNLQQNPLKQQQKNHTQTEQNQKASPPEKTFFCPQGVNNWHVAASKVEQPLSR